MATAGSLPRMGRVSSWADKIVLAVVFLTGVAGIVVLKYYDYPKEIIPLFPAALMILYFFYILQSRRFRLREDVAGDNLYYLGFLYTLTSLAYALYAFASREEAPTEIVTEFGVALVTTILGILLRVIAIQLREDPVEIEREARLELADAATRLRGVLGAVVLDMNHFRRQIAQSIEEGMAAVADHANKSVTETAEHFREVTDALLKHMEAGAGTRTEISQRLNELVANTITAFEAVLERINRIEPPADLIERTLAPAVQMIEQAAESARARASAGAEEVRQVLELISKTTSASADLDRRVEAVVDVLRLFDPLGAGLASFTAALAAQETSVAATLEKHYQALEALKKAAESRASEATASFTMAIAEQEKVLRGFRDEFQTQQTKALASLTETVREHTTALQELRDGVAAALAAIRVHSGELQAELDRSRGMTLELQGELVNLAETVTRRLG